MWGRWGCTHILSSSAVTSLQSSICFALKIIKNVGKRCPRMGLVLCGVDSPGVEVHWWCPAHRGDGQGMGITGNPGDPNAWLLWELEGSPPRGQRDNLGTVTRGFLRCPRHRVPRLLGAGELFQPSLSIGTGLWGQDEDGATHGCFLQPRGSSTGREDRSPLRARGLAALLLHWGFGGWWW